MIMSPDNEEQVHTALNAELEWINHQYYDTHRKIGLRFYGLPQQLQQEMNLLLYQIETMATRNLKCSLVAH